MPSWLLEKLTENKAITSATLLRDPDMAPPTPRLVVPIDLKKQPREQKFPLHNRWHPDVPPVAEVKTGEVIRVEMLDWTGGIIKDDDSANDVKFIDLSIVSMRRKTLYITVIIKDSSN